MTVICFVCRKECSDYEFRSVDGDVRPVCSVCSGRKKVMESVVVLQESRLERAWNGKDTKLEGWFK